MNTIYRTAIEELVFHLDIMLVPHGEIETMEVSHGYQIHFPWTAGDVAINDWTYHSDDGYVESWRFKFDDGDVTFKMPAEMAALVKAEYIEWKLNPRYYIDKVEEEIEDEE